MDDKRLEQVTQEQNQQLEQVTNAYDEMKNQSDSFYNNLINTSKEYAQQQQDIQNQQTELALNEIEQNKKYAQQDYNREQRGAYLDYQAQQKNQADLLRQAGLQNTGYTESTISSMYSTYQNRVATARESFNRSVDAYNQQAAQARLANSSALMDIAYKALQQQAEYALQGFQYKNQLTIDLLGKQQGIRSEYWNKYQDVQKQINTEKALAEEIRQYNQNYALNKKKTDADVAQTKAQTALIKAQTNNYKSGSSSKSVVNAGSNNKTTQKKSDYMTSVNGSERPQYINNKKWTKAAVGGETMTLKDVDSSATGSLATEPIVGIKDDKGNVKYYVWLGSEYKDITNEATKAIAAKEQALKNQPKTTNKNSSIIQIGTPIKTISSLFSSLFK